jgi:hypothetical protein
MLKIYEVLGKFNSNKDYGFDIRRQYGQCLSVMKKGDKINSREFAIAHRGEFVQRRNTIEANLAVVQQAVSIGKRIGMLKEIPHDKVPILYKDFCKLPSISKFRNRVSGSNRENTKSSNDGSKDTYTRHLHYFNNWIVEKTIQYTKLVPLNENDLRKQKMKVKLTGIEHFLELYAENYLNKKPFVDLITDYFFESDVKLIDPQTKKIRYFAIKNYFKKNNLPIVLDFDPNEGSRPASDDLEPIMYPNEFLQILTIGQPSLTEKAVFLCKFQRGLDSSTLVDRFNKEAWSQIVKEFGTEDYEKWDLKECPLMIKLTRVKTNVSHFGFLDRDAITALIEYLKYREKITGKELSNNEFLFLNESQNPITEGWINASFNRMRKKAGLDEIINKKKVANGGKRKYRISAHETRDLLKSILIESGVRHDLVEEFIGHKPNDTYEKQVTIFKHTPKTEYVKASGRVNIFSKVKGVLSGEYDNVEEIRGKVSDMELKMQKMAKKISRTNNLKRKK